MGIGYFFRRDRHASCNPHHRFQCPGTGHLRPADGKPAAEPGRPRQCPVCGRKPAGYRPGAGRRVRAGVLPDGNEAYHRQGRRNPRPLSGRHPGLCGGTGSADPAYRLSPDPGDALRHAAAAAACGGVPVCVCPADCRAGKRDESHQYRRHFPLRCGAGHGRRAADRRRKRPSVPPGQPGQHGQRLSGALDVPAGG